jgi:hypothetical protein
VRPRRDLTWPERTELLYGPAGGIPPVGADYGHPRHLGECTVFRCGDSAFRSEEERRAAWWAHRDELLPQDEDLCGHRPRGWWWYEADAVCSHSPRCERPPRPTEAPDYAAQTAAWLARHGVMGPAELAFVSSWDDGGPGVHAAMARAVAKAVHH